MIDGNCSFLILTVLPQGKRAVSISHLIFFLMKVILYIALVSLSLGLCSCQTDSDASLSLPVHCELEALGDTIKKVLSVKVMGDNITEIEQMLDKALSEMEGCSLGPYKDSLAEVYRRLGNAIWDTNYDSTRIYYQKGLTYNPTGLILGKLLSNIGMTYYNEKEYQLALVYFDSALSVKPSFQDSLYYKNTESRIGDSYVKLGQPNIGEQYLQHALDKALESGSPKNKGEVCELMSNCKRELHQYKEAIEIGKKGIEFLEVGRLPTSDKLYFTILANCYQNVGNAWQDYMQQLPRNSTEWRNAAQSASEYYESARSFYVELEDEGNLITVMSNLGELYRRLGLALKAKELLTEAIGTIDSEAQESSSKSSMLGPLYINRGEAFMDVGNFSAAESDFDSALYYLAPAYLPGSSQISFDSVGPNISPELTITAIHNKATLMVKKSRGAGNKDYTLAMETALAIYDSLSVFTNEARKNYLTEEDKVSLTLKTRPYLDSAFLYCLELSKLLPENGDFYIKKAFEFTEQSKARTLLETRQSNRYNASLTSEKLEYRRTLAKERDSIMSTIFQNRDNPEKLIAVKQQWLEHLRRWRSFQDSFTQGYGSLTHSKNKSVEELQKDILDVDQALLAYHEIDSTLYVFFVEKSRIRLAVVPVGATFFEDIARFDTLISTKEFAPFVSIPEKKALFLSISKRIYDNLFPDTLSNSLPERLIIIPNDLLQALAFDALWTSEEIGPGIDHYLLFKHAISYAPSANLLWEMRNSRTEKLNPQRMVAFAPHFPKKSFVNSSNLLLPKQGVMKNVRFDSLPNEGEVHDISKAVDTEIITKKDANKQNFWTACSEYKVIHIPTHGVLFQDDPRFNFISFSQMSESIQTDEFLFMHELYSHEKPLDLELVAFPGCETARGTFVESEGHISMAFGLAAAGVRSFIVTFWKTDGYATKDIMPKFYEALADNTGMPKDLALANAKRAYLEDQDHWDPNNWAGIILMGDAVHLPLKRANSLTIYFWLLPIFVLLSIILRQRLRRKKLQFEAQ